jgi:hypothetical protein
MQERSDAELYGYRSEDGWSLSRESGLTPAGNDIGGRWVLRDALGFWVDMGMFRHDLAEEHSLKLMCNSR